MTTSTVWTTSAALFAGAVMLTLMPFGAGAGAQVAIKRSPTGFNLFTVQQDIDIGRQAAAEIERQVSLVNSARTAQFLANVTLALTQGSRTAYPFQVKVINSGEVNLIVLPGGQIYVTRGLLSLTKSEAEVAGIVAHAMGHVVLRHGTARTSRAYVTRVGLSALGGFGDSNDGDRIVNTVGGFGMKAAFLRFTRSDEYEADALGAEFLSSAGYDPVAIATLLATVRREHSRLAGLDRFHAAHPPASDREIRVRNLSNVLRHGRSEIVGGFNRMRWQGAGMTTVSAPEVQISTGSVAIRSTLPVPKIPAPSAQFTRFTDPDSTVSIDFPSNWDAHQSGASLSFVPAGGVIEREDGAPSLVQGVIVSQYEPFDDDVERWNNSLTRNYAPFDDRSRPRGVLEDATDDIVRQIMTANNWLSAPTRSARPYVVDGIRGYAVRLSGRSPVTGQVERVTLYTRALPDDHIVYMACVAAGQAVSSVEKACSRMVQSLRVNDSSLHRQQRH